MKRYLTESGGRCISDNLTLGSGVRPTAKVAADILSIAGRRASSNPEKHI
jgi:hypothetical protein